MQLSAEELRKVSGGITATTPRGAIVASLRRLYWVRIRARLAPSETQRLFLLTALIGASCGLAAVVFHLCIRFAETNLIDRALAAPGDSWIAWTILTPALGGLACGILLHYVVPRARGSGIPDVKAIFARRGSELRLRDSLGKFGLSTLQIGTGSSLGREGPTVQICAGIANACGKLARVSPKNLRRLVPVGAAAGIAAAFNAPVAAVTFTIEEIVGDLDRTVLSGVIVAAAIAAVIERGVLGTHPVFDVHHEYGLDHVSSLAVYATLGVAAGLLAVVFTDSLLALRQRFLRVRVLPGWAKPAVGGLVAGLLAVVALRAFRAHGITGGGYGTLEEALNGQLDEPAMLALCGLKIAATVFCYASGGAGGVFAPALFIGGMLGGALGILDVAWLGHADASIGAFTLVGMGAFFAGAVRAPITSVLIIAEMTGSYALILPLMIANTIAYGLARWVRPMPLYEALLAQDGVRLHQTAGIQVLENVQLDHVVSFDVRPVQFDETSRASELLAARSRQGVYPVVDSASGRLLGIITDEELELLASEHALHAVVNATDVMRPPVSVRGRDDLRTALEAMLAHGLRHLPVVDDELRVTGLLDEATVARAYLRGNTA